jgi:15-cis-phytoene synthase
MRPLNLDLDDYDTAAEGYAADLAQCRALLRTGSRTFYAASFLLPRRVRDPATALYAFCRLADDAVDLSDTPIDQLALLKERLDRAYAGDPADHSADRAFARTIHRFNVPKALPAALLEGFEWDGRNQRYETLSELHGYAARVAGTVGAMMALLMGARETGQIARATDLGAAMQLTNIARDVGEDARNGRLYLPRQWMREAGLDPEAWLAEPVFNEALASVIARLLVAASELYERAGSGIQSLPADCRPGIYAARFLYAEIGHELERKGLDSVSRRTVVSAGRKAQLLARAFAAAAPNKEEATNGLLEEARFLVEAAAAAGWSSDAILAATRTRAGAMPPWWDFHGRAVRMVEFFEHLERRDKATRTAAMQISERPIDGSLSGVMS